MSEEINNTEETEQIVLIEKQSEVANATFKVLTEGDPKESWKTNYQYYLKQKATGASVRPLIGRYQDKQFQVYDEGTWVDKNYWDYADPLKDSAGVIVKGPTGKPRQVQYFTCKHIWKIEFDEPEKVSFYDKELKQNLVEKKKIVEVALSKNLSEKLKVQINDPRNPEGVKFKINYDPSKAPADQYSVTFSA